MTSKIANSETLAPYILWDAIIRTTLGVCFELKGVLHNSKSLCWYDVRLPDGQVVNFSWGNYEVLTETKVIIITIN